MASPQVILSLHSAGDNVKNLHATLAKLGFLLPSAETSGGTFGQGTQDAIRQIQMQFKLPATGALDPATGAVVQAAAAAFASNNYAVAGRLFLDCGLPAANVVVRAYSIGFAGADTKLGEGKTDANGLYSISYPAQRTLHLEIRVVDAAGKETAISAPKFDAGAREVLNLVVPTRVQPLAPEYQRLTTDLAAQIDGIARLAQAQENGSRRDLTLLSQSTEWDARLVALAATATQKARETGLGPDVLYALYRVGLPTDSQRLATVPGDSVKAALIKAAGSGIVGLNDQQISAAVASFDSFASRTILATVAPGGVSKFSDFMAAVPSDKQAAFAKLYMSNSGSGADFWQKAAALNVGKLDPLKLQGKFLYLTFNNSALADKVQKDVGSIDKLSTLVDKGYHNADTWKRALTELSGGNAAKLAQLIPAHFADKDPAKGAEAYAADLARKVRFSFPTHVTAGMVQDKSIAVDDATRAPVSGFLKAAASAGYELGRSRLAPLLAKLPAGSPELDANGKETVKRLHRMYQVTPSTESFQAVMKTGFKSAFEIASYSREEFLGKYGMAFPSQGEASLVHGRAQQVSSVTFNFFALAKQMATAPPVYSMSPSDGDRQMAKNTLVQQFPNLTTLFGAMDYCQCEDCRSVLSPAAYFVDLLEFLRQSAANPTGYTPLDVLIGKDATVKGRRPDLGALPLSCANTNTAMPYIDIVNEILEYYIVHIGLDANLAYDTGDATTADLVAEPQHIQPSVYNQTLKTAVYPLTLPFDLGTETVRGFLNYYNSPLSQVLEMLRPADDLELFTDANAYPYYRAQIFAESLGLSPSDYGVLTSLDPNTHNPSVQKWYGLYGYADEPTALNGKLNVTDPTVYDVPPLKSAKNLANRLGLTYQEVTDLVTTGFLNPALNALMFQFERFGIPLDKAFAYTSQPGYTPLAGQDKADFEALLTGITQTYKPANPTFDAKTWLGNSLTANYSKKVLLLRAPVDATDFGATMLQYADGSPATALDFLKFNLFVRLWKKLGWSLDETDRALQLFFPSTLPAWGDAGFAAAFSAAWRTALVYLANLETLNRRLNPAMGRASLLPLWSNLPVLGTDPLYAQLFLTASVLNNDAAFDDPQGKFPALPGDPLSSHQAAVLGACGLTADELNTVLADAGTAVSTVAVLINGQNVNVPGFSLGNLSIAYRYSLLAKCLSIPVSDLVALKAMSGLDPFPQIAAAPLSKLVDDKLFTTVLAFVDSVAAVSDSGFSVEDLKYLLRHQFDPVGKYQADPNAFMALVQTIGNGLRQIQSQYGPLPQFAQSAAPIDLSGVSDDLIEQKLSALLPSAVVKSLLTLLMGAPVFHASKSGIAPANKIDPAPFGGEPQIKLSYDAPTQTQSLDYTGVLTDWKKTALLKINNSADFSDLLNGVQQQAHDLLRQRVDDVLGVWASLVEYESALTGIAAAIPPDPLSQKDPAVRLSYDQADKVQWLGYRGVLTESNKAALTGVNPSATLNTLLLNVQSQAMPAYRQLVGTLLAMWASTRTYVSVQSAVAPANQIDPSLFSGYPELQFSYDAAGQVQTLTCTAFLTDARRIEMAAIVPASAVLAGLLQDVRNQALQFFQFQATGLLTANAGETDAFAQPFNSISDTAKQKLLKKVLVSTFLPLIGQKLAHQLVTQTVSANLGFDPSFTDTLLVDAGVLTDPTDPGKSLLGSFLAVGQQGVTAKYFASTDGTGIALASAVAATVDLADASNPNANKAGTGSAHFEGYLQVPTDGPYRFFAELGDQNAKAVLTIDSPDPTALFTNPILTITAAKNGDEGSQFVHLKGGIAYAFTVDFSTLGARGASLLIQGETMPKGPLAQAVLYPQSAVDQFARGNVLLAKVVQLIQGFNLDEREVSHFAANASQFNNLRFGALPTAPADDSPAGAQALFSQFLALADYADLRRGPAGGSDRLIDVFENVGETFTEPLATQSATQNADAPWKRLADLVRRDAQLVRDVAKFFRLVEEQTAGPNRQVSAVGNFANPKGIRRIWEAVQIVQLIAIPFASLQAATVIASSNPPLGSPASDVVAANLKNAVKARYAPETWRPIAQSVFDKLRQKKRDALVAYLLNTLQLDTEQQLFEYFLVDPGMEPVVQTSRLRLALSSVQTFIQRCLLNLENDNEEPAKDVAPSAIEADWWQWMKRYRVWQANREIFLFPENWMEPELRLDKTDLFEALEGTLLQGDVNRDLVESAFLDYLKGLEVRARLDIVSMHIDQDLTHPGNSTTYVIGRSYGKPHQYFHRTYNNGSWSAWIPITANIDGDHVAAVVWRGRLNLFWITFMKKSVPSTHATQDSDSTNVSGMNFGQLSTKMFEAAPKFYVDMQLNWIEYFQGKWSDRIATDMGSSDVQIPVGATFDPRQDVYIHVSKEFDSTTKNELGVRIHLDVDGTGYGFRVTSKNCTPGFSTKYGSLLGDALYGTSGIDATALLGSNVLEVTFDAEISTDGTVSKGTEQILDQAHEFGLLIPDNPVAPPFLDQTDPEYQEAGKLVSPFFYKDLSSADVTNERTFFVQPSLTETTLAEWEYWAVPSGPPGGGYVDPNWLKGIDVVAQIPRQIGPPNPGDPYYSKFQIGDRMDWVTNPSTVVSYGDSWIGGNGEVNVALGGSRTMGGIATNIMNGPGAGAVTGSYALVGKEGLTSSHLQIISVSKGLAMANTGGAF